MHERAPGLDLACQNDECMSYVFHKLFNFHKKRTFTCAVCVIKKCFGLGDEVEVDKSRGALLCDNLIWVFLEAARINRITLCFYFPFCFFRC